MLRKNEPHLRQPSHERVWEIPYQRTAWAEVTGDTLTVHDFRSFRLFPGLYRQYELSYIPCEESDAVRVRTNFRKGEDVRLYRTIATPEQARARLMEFVASMNRLRDQPRFYNILTSNCTTAVRSQMTNRFPMDWRIILNGKLDAMLHERGVLVTDGLPFAELSRRALINPQARAHPGVEGFSDRIREGIPGFGR